MFFFDLISSQNPHATDVVTLLANGFQAEYGGVYDY